MVDRVYDTSISFSRSRELVKSGPSQRCESHWLICKLDPRYCIRRICWSAVWLVLINLTNSEYMTISKLGSIGYSYIPEEGPRSFYGVTMAKYSDTFSKGSSASIRTRSRPSYIMPVYVSWQPASAPTKCNAHQHPSEFHLKGTWSRERGVIKQRERNAEINTYMKIRKLLRHLMIFSRGLFASGKLTILLPAFHHDNTMPLL